MKSFYYRWLFVTLAAIVLSLPTACSNDDDDDEPYVEEEIINENDEPANQYFYITGCFLETAPLTNNVLYLDSMYSITTRYTDNGTVKRRFKEDWAKKPQLLYHSQPYTDGYGYYYNTASVTDVNYQGDPEDTDVKSYACISVKDYAGNLLANQEVEVQNQNLNDCIDGLGHSLTILVSGDSPSTYKAFKNPDYFSIYYLSSHYYKSGRTYNNPYAENNDSGGSSGNGNDSQDSSWEKSISADYHYIGDSYATSGHSDFKRSVTVRYEASSGKYYMYESYFNPSSNNGKGLRYDAQKGYNSIKVWSYNYGPDSWGVYHLCECYVRFTID